MIKNRVLSQLQEKLRAAVNANNNNEKIQNIQEQLVALIRINKVFTDAGRILSPLEAKGLKELYRMR